MGLLLAILTPAGETLFCPQQMGRFSVCTSFLPTMGSISLGSISIRENALSTKQPQMPSVRLITPPLSLGF